MFQTDFWKKFSFGRFWPKTANLCHFWPFFYFFQYHIFALSIYWVFLQFKQFVFLIWYSLLTAFTNCYLDAGVSSENEIPPVSKVFSNGFSGVNWLPTLDTTIQSITIHLGTRCLDSLQICFQENHYSLLIVHPNCYHFFNLL